MAGLTGPAIGSDGTVYISLAAGRLICWCMQTAWWPAPAAKGQGLVHAFRQRERKDAECQPVLLTYKDKELIAAPGKDGSIVLLDSESLGGKDHHTPLAETSDFKGTRKGAWESLASWQDKHGGLWVLASISGRSRE